MKRMILASALVFFLQFFNPIFSQLNNEQRQLILQDVNQHINKTFFVGPQNITTQQLLFRKTAVHAITQAIENNELILANQYFDVYASILDTLVIANPIAAREIVFSLNSIFKNMPVPSERLAYYSSSVEYYLGFYSKAESELINFQSKYPDSALSNQSFTLLLKTYLNSGKEADGLKALQKRIEPLTDEQNYLAGHICYTLEADDFAENYFKKVVSEKFLPDSSKMLALLSALKFEPIKAKETLRAQLANEPSNPFLLLNLARLSSLSGDWQEASQYYAKYIPAVKKHREMQVQYELATAYLNLGEKDKALALLDNAIMSREIGEYIGPFLYLWSEIAAVNGKADIAKVRTNNIRDVLEANADILAEKIQLINRIDSLKESAGEKSNSGFVMRALDEVDFISTKLDSLNSSLSQDYYGISQPEFDRWLVLEKQIILSFLEQLNYYVAAENITDVKDTLNVLQLDTIEAIYKEQIKRINTIRKNVLKLNERNTYLALRNEVDNNLVVMDKILNNLLELKSSKDPTYSIEQLDSLIAVNERKKTGTKMLLDYYDYDNTLYKEVLAECEASNNASIEILKEIISIRRELNDTYPKFIAYKEKKEIARDIAQLPLLIPEYINLVSSYHEFLKKIKIQTEYTGYHISFIEASDYDKNRKQNEAQLTFEASQKLYNENMIRKQIVYNQINNFVHKYTGESIDLEQLANYSINIMANAHFALAELSNSLEQDRPRIALNHYRKVLELEPKFYLADAVLYNIGYISSSIAKDQMQVKVSNFEEMYPTRIRPDSLALSDALYREAIDAYKRVTEEFKDSQYYSEALFRLGYLYFEIGTEATQPIDYYRIARSYYDFIINNDNDPYRFKALYQRGWTWLNSSTEEAYLKAIDDFSTILTAIDQKLITDKTEIIDYSLAAKKNIGYCLIGLDGTDYSSQSHGAEYVKEKLVSHVSKNDLNEIIDEAISQKLALYLPLQAIDFMRIKMDIDSLSVNNPIIADSICTIYKTYPTHLRTGISPESVYIAEREKIISRFNHKSAWYAANKDKDILRQLHIIKQAFIDVEKRYNNEFVDYPNVTNFEKYIGLVNLYTQFHALQSLYDPQYLQWNEAIQANIIAQNVKLTQLTKNPVYYLALANRIYAFNDQYPDNKSFFNLEGTAYDCARIVVDSLKIELTELKLENPLLVIPFNAEDSYNYFQLASRRFLHVLADEKFKNSGNDLIYIAVVLRQAEIAREMKDYTQSVTYYNMIVQYPGEVSPGIKRTSLISLAELAETNQHYKEAENLYSLAEEYSIDDNDREILHQYALLQIQNSVDQARDNGNNQLVAEEYLRLAAAYNDVEKKLQYKGKAQLAYLDAEQYQKSIDILLEIAQTKTSPSEVFSFYQLAWSIADSVDYKDQSDSLKHKFVLKYPASNEAYQLRLGFIDNLESDPSAIEQAADMSLRLYEDIINNRIDAGKDNPVDLYLAVIGMYDKAGDEKKKEELTRSFLEVYPNHPSTIQLMEYLAEKELALGNTSAYEQYAKSIFLKDKNNNLRYTNIAKDNLGKIAVQFTKAYRDKNWKESFSLMDEFKKLLASYEKEGLDLDFAPVYSAFNAANKEFEVIKERDAFVKQFRQTLDNTEKGLITQKAVKLIRVNIYTKWKRHLVSGENRISALKTSTDKEIAKIKNALDAGGKYNLGVEDRLRAFNLICRIAEHSAEVTQTQIDKYMAISVEFDGYKKQYRGEEDELYRAFNAQKEGHYLSFLQLAYPYYLVMYKYFYIPGLRNHYTISAYNQLKSLNALPNYRIDRIYPTSEWNLSVANLDNQTKATNFNDEIQQITSPKGEVYSQIIVPPDSELVIQKIFSSRVPFEFAVANVISPYFENTEVKLNDKILEYTYHPVDTLRIEGKDRSRQAIILGENKFNPGNNVLELRFPNYNEEPLIIACNLMLIRDSLKIKAATPVETKTLVTNDVWQYAAYSEDIKDIDWTCAEPAWQFGFEKNQMFEMENTNSLPIWTIPEDEDADSLLVFRKIFYVDGIMQQGAIRFIAPEFATVKLNNQVLTADYPLNYDEETKLVFAGKLTLKPENIRTGKNTLQIIVNNQSTRKGLLAEIELVLAYPE